MPLIATDYWMPQEGPQVEAYTCPADEIFFGGNKGGGKAQSYQALTLTPFGFKQFGDLKIESQICNPAGGVANVIAIFEQGIKKLYRFTFDDGASTLSTLEHLWLYRLTGNTSKVRRYLHDNSPCNWRIATTEMLLRGMDRGKRIRMPLTAPVTFTVARRRKMGIDPYVLGLLLGDGSISGSRISYSTGDSELIYPILSAGFNLQTSKSDDVFTFGLPRDTDLYQKIVKSKLYGKYSFDKYIPDEYKMGSIDTRWKILQGLCDTDGHADKRGHIQFVLVSQQLAKDVQFIVRSLGGKATMTDKIGSYKDKFGKKHECRVAYMLYIQMIDKSKCFQLERKKKRCENKEWNGGIGELTRKLIKVEEAGKGNTRCIKVDHPNGLYLADDFIVTHNSDCVIGRQIKGAITHGYKWSGFICRRKYKDLKEMRKRFDELIRVYNLPAERVGGETQINYIRFKNGATIILAAISFLDMVNDWWGNSFCVEKGTLIRMASGKTLSIEDIRVGDEVQTLEGPKKVLRCMPPKLSPCVSATTSSGTQVHPTNHPILTVYGWQSYASILENDSIDIELIHRGSLQPPDVCVLAVLYKPSQELLPYSGWKSILSYVSCKFSKLNLLKLFPLNQLQKWMARKQLCVKVQQVQRHASLRSPADGISYGQHGLGMIKDFLYHCFSYLYQDGEQPLLETNTSQSSALLPVDAGAPYRKNYNLGVRNGIPEDSPYDEHYQHALGGPLVRPYSHPYTGELRDATVDTEISSCVFSYIGMRTVYDLTIEDVNHYVSWNGIINVNTEIAIDEGPTFPFISPMIDKLKGSLRSAHGIPCQMFITGNPGGPGSAQIKMMFIPPEMGGDCPSPEGVPYSVETKAEDGSTSTISRVFIKSELKNNIYLYGTDGKKSAYANRLLTIQNKELRAAWIEGRWDTFIGQAFDFSDKNIIEPIWPIPEYAPLFMTFDYGFGAPFSVQWWWVDGDNRLYLFSELYGCQKGMPNVGVRKTDQDIALAILEHEEKLGILGRSIKRIGGSDCFRKKPDYKGGGQGSATSDAFRAFMNNPSAVERWGKGTSLKMAPGDDRRETKIRQFRNRLALPAAGELPMLVVYDTCKNFIRIIPTLCTDEVAGEDLEDGQEDHVYDSAALVAQHMPIGVTDEEISVMLQETARTEKLKGLDNVSRAATEDYQMTLDHILAEQEAVSWFQT